MTVLPGNLYSVHHCAGYAEETTPGIWESHPDRNRYLRGVYFRYPGRKRRQVSQRCDVCASALPDSRGFHPQPERCRVLFIIGKICFPALLLVLIFQALLKGKFSTVFGAVLEGLLVLLNSYLNMKWVYCV